MIPETTTARLAAALFDALPALAYFDEHEGAPHAHTEARAALAAYEAEKAKAAR